MSKISRRSVMAGMAIMPFGLWLQKEEERKRPHREHIRYDARSPQGQAMLKIYAEAVCKMMDAIKEGDPTSWVFQWYTHWVKGSTSKTAEINRIYGAGPSPHKSLAQDMWNTCQAHGAGENEDFFLPWHRMFVYYFETIIREVSKKEEFTLPYWNYSTSVPAIHGVMPDDFRKKGDPIYKCLFVDKRNVHTPTNTFANVNAGEAIDKYEPGTLALTALKQTTYSPAGAMPGFNMDLDQSVHGMVHVLTGNSQNMGAVPWAAGDPIFWMHHCNIDRLWASWNHCGGKNPTDPAWLNQTFVFADAEGKKVVTAIKDVDTTAQLHYTYDHLEPCPLKFVALNPAEIAAIKTVVLASVTPSAPLTKQPVRMNLELRAPEAQKGLQKHTQSLPPERKLYLVIKNLRANLHPETVYHVYLDLPAGTDPKNAQNYEVGTINFFNSVPHQGHSGAMETNTEKKFYSFDVTEKAKKVLQEKPTVTIAPLGEPASEAKPVVGEISLVEQ
jgi:tyrosinase